MNINLQKRNLTGALRVGAIFGAAALCGVTISPGVGAVDAESVFLEASAYTVKIRARITTAFIEDVVGTSTGAGFLVDAERGWIITNAHVAGRSPAIISSAFRDRPFITAHKVFVDPYLDLAVLRVDLSGTDYAFMDAPLDCDDIPPVGHPIAAFGYPWDLEFTGTRGIVSGTTADRDGMFIRMDAATNPGNSGGPLVSLEAGRVVGISMATLAEDSDQNTNFAVPMVFVCRVLEILKSGRDPSPPRVPVVFLGPLRDRTALIVARSYLPESLLDLRPGDEILGVQGLSDHIANEAQLIHALRGKLDDVHLKVKRAGKELFIKGRLAAAPLVTDRVGVVVSGLLIAPPGFRDSSILGADDGLMVHDVEPGSAGEDLGFEVGDILTIVNGKRYDDAKRLFTALNNARELEQSVTIEVLRGSNSNTAIFDYVRRDLPIESLSFISGQ